jgi:fructose-bisphosphate aldolase class II
MEAASGVDAPVIIQASRGARSYANDIMLKHMMDAVTEIYPHIPVCVHLDHGNEAETCMTAIQAGFTSVMMDGSLKADGKTRPTGTTMSASPRRVVRHGASRRHLGGRRDRRARLAGERHGRAEDGHGAEGQAQP